MKADQVKTMQELVHQKLERINAGGRPRVEVSKGDRVELESELTEELKLAKRRICEIPYPLPKGLTAPRVAGHLEAGGMVDIYRLPRDGGERWEYGTQVTFNSVHPVFMDGLKGRYGVNCFVDKAETVWYDGPSYQAFFVDSTALPVLTDVLGYLRTSTRKKQVSLAIAFQRIQQRFDTESKLERHRDEQGRYVEENGGVLDERDRVREGFFLKMQKLSE